jgi:hypothetical protein
MPPFFPPTMLKLPLAFLILSHCMGFAWGENADEGTEQGSIDLPKDFPTEEVRSLGERRAL